MWEGHEAFAYLDGSAFRDVVVQRLQAMAEAGDLSGTCSGEELEEAVVEAHDDVLKEWR